MREPTHFSTSIIFAESGLAMICSTGISTNEMVARLRKGGSALVYTRIRNDPTMPPTSTNTGSSTLANFRAPMPRWIRQWMLSVCVPGSRR